jgi:predicted GTPase
MVFLGSLPFLALMALGGWWLWQQQMLLLWLTVSASCSGVVWIMARWLNRRQQQSAGAGFVPAQQRLNSQLDEQIWQVLAGLTVQLKQDKSLDLAVIDNWIGIGQQVLAVVAGHYRPKHKNPELSIPITDLLQIVEQVSHDLRWQLQESVPFSHVVTLADGLNLQRWLEHVQDAKTVLRVGRMLLNPFSGFLNEASAYAQDKVVDLTLPHLKSLLLEMYIEKVAEYAILLYSGRLAATAQVARVSPLSAQQSHQAQVLQDSQAQEPLRILVAGQTNAGKSSLINALCEQLVAVTDIQSCTAEVSAYQLQREGMLSGLIFDTPGYGELSHWLAANPQILDQTDLLLLVCAAQTAARQADYRFLQDFQQHFLAQVQRKLPVIIVVVSHIDLLSPRREWLPPYDIEAPVGLKAKNIQAALEAIAADLALPANTAMVPVSLGDNEGMGPYNVESLLLAMGQQLDEAHQARLLRCLKAGQGREKWPQLWRQVGSSGRWLLRKAGRVLP